MKLTRSNIENIRNQAKRQRLEPSADQIRAAVAECYPEASDDAEFDTQMIPSVVDILLAQQPPQPLALPKTESTIVLSEGDKQDLVAGAAREAGLQLVASEIKTIATDIRSGFDSREQLLSEVMNAIVAYAENRIDQHSASLTAAATRIRLKIDAGNKDARNAFASIDAALEATSNDLKSEFEGITALFPTAANWN
jgi:hypothetical protein